MKRESRLLFAKAVDSLVLGIEHYNRPWDRGRVDAVLILLDHSFEMLLKAAILHRGGVIRKLREKQTIGFDECLRKALSDGSVQFLKQEQVLQLQALNTLRDAAQHHLVDLSEQHLYIHAQAGLTMFRDITREVFNQDLKVHLPPRVLPLSTTPPSDLATLFEHEAKEVRRLLEPGKRRKVEALGFYNLGRDQVARHLELSGPKTTALIRHLEIQEDAECYRRITIGQASFDRYSQKAIDRLREALKAVKMDDVWAEYQAGRRRRARQ